MPVPLSLKTKLSAPLLAETRDSYRDLFGSAVLEEWDDPADRGCILGLGGSGGQAFLEIFHCDDPPDFAGLSLTAFLSLSSRAHRFSGALALIH